MVRIAILLVMYLVSQFIGAQTTNTSNESLNKSVTENVTITVTVPNVSSAEGTVLFALYDSNEKFMKREPLDSKSGNIANGTTTITFENIIPGTYAIVSLHDKNGNERMDFNESGMPAEDYGISNNVMITGPPNFEDAKFVVGNKSLDLTIKF